MGIDWKARCKSAVFWAQLVLAVLMPILTYFGLNGSDVTTWQILGETLLNAVSNPYVCALVIVNVWQTVNNPTTPWLTDNNGKNAINKSSQK